MLRPKRSPEAIAEITHTLRKCRIKANLNLNTQGLVECEKSASLKIWDLSLTLKLPPLTLRFSLLFYYLYGWEEAVGITYGKYCLKQRMPVKHDRFKFDPNNKYIYLSPSEDFGNFLNKQF